MPSFKLKTFSLILSVLILGSFYSYGLWAWTGPASMPPGSNVPTPVNIGTSDQEKTGRLSATEFYDADNSYFYINPSGDSKVSGTLSLGGDLYDVTNSKKIYDSTTGKFDPSVMPYEKGDLASDWATNTDFSAYYDSTYDPSKVMCGVNMMRGKPSGTLCDTCYSCSSGICSPATVEGAAATALRCTAGDEGCRYCNNGSCGAYDDNEQHGCPSGSVCVSGQCNSFAAICTTSSGVITAPNGDKVFCYGGKMWSHTLDDAYEWGHYGETVGNCTTSSDSTYPACYACNTLNYAGLSDWHLPDSDTLKSIWDGEENTYFQCNSDNCYSWDQNCCNPRNYDMVENYWSNEECDWNNSYSWFVRFSDGYVHYDVKNRPAAVRCVRS